MEINVKEYLVIAGRPSGDEKEAALALGAHFELVAREGDPIKLRQDLENAREAYAWWTDQPKPNDLLFWAEQERNYRMMIWIAERQVEVAETRDYRFPEYLKIERKHTAPYFTPKVLIDLLLDSALKPVLDEAMGTSRSTTDSKSHG